MSTPRQAAYPVHPLFLERWSPRAFSGEPISQETLFTLLEAARWAPSAFNFQPWRFVWALRNTSAWTPIFEALNERNRLWVQRTAALVVVTSKKTAQFPGRDTPGPNPLHSFDSGAAWASLAFQASLMGLGAHAMSGFDAGKLEQAIALPAEHHIEVVVAVGVLGDKADLPEEMQAREAPNGRKPLTELIVEGHFSA